MTDQEKIAIVNGILALGLAKDAQAREKDLIDEYGECCTKARAGKILSKHPTTIYAMIRDGRLKAVCGGEKVCVHSIHDYLEAPKQADFKARVTRRNGKTPRFYVSPSERKVTP